MATSSLKEAGQATSLPASASESDTNSFPQSQDKRATTTTGIHANTVLHAHRQSHNSSKLPAFRFADLVGKPGHQLNVPNLLQRAPPSPISPGPGPESQTAVVPAVHSPSGSDQQPKAIGSPQNLPFLSQQTHNTNTHHPSSNQAHLVDANHKDATLLQPKFLQTRASSFRASSTSAPTTATPLVRSVSYPASLSAIESARLDSTASHASTGTSSTAHAQKPNSAVNGDEARPWLSLSSPRSQVADSQNPQAHPPHDTTKEWAHGQRELLLPKTIDLAKADEKARSRPPLSYRSPSLVSPSTGRAIIPPIRAFRSSGSRKSWSLDMHARRVSDDSSYEEDITDPNVRDNTLRALEGRRTDSYSHMTPPHSADATPDNDNTADLFMRIAHEDPTRRTREPSAPSETPSAISRTIRFSHRRPLSVAVPTSQGVSPPEFSRRHSDQRDTSRTVRSPPESAIQHLSKEYNRRPATKDRAKPSWSPNVESPAVKSSFGSSPITPRQNSFQEEALQSISAYSRRRSSVTDPSTGLPTRGSHPRASNLAGAQGRTYNSSPLVPRPAETQRQEGQHGTELTPGMEGTESSASTAAPSTVWDELDDLKSRIHRLELTGKAPPSSAAAMSRVVEDRPPTATTNATTISASPKRAAMSQAIQADVASVVSSHRDAQPILLSALAKAKGAVAPSVFSALESAANDAMMVSSMMGAAGHPGLVSSAASVVGVNGGMTDRQLRRKAESVCRSLTELCLALADEGSTAKQLPAPPPPQVQPMAVTPQKEPQSPTSTRATGLAAQRRGSAFAEQQSLMKGNAVPRTPATMDQRRYSVANVAALPSPRYGPAPTVTQPETPAVGRKSSLLIARTRRAGTEEPEESPYGRQSSLLRTRRAATEEPEDNREVRNEGRNTSLLLRTRRGTIGEEEPDMRYRIPSRANTDLYATRGLREPSTPAKTVVIDSTPSSAISMIRRRAVPSSLNSRLVAPTPSTTLGSRRLAERETQDRDTNSVVERMAEGRAQRQLPLSQAGLGATRTSSISRRRDSAIPSLVSPSAQGSAYR